MPVAMKQVLEAWALVSHMHTQTNEGVPADDLALAEKVLRRSLPQSAREFYSVYDGGWFLGGNIVISPLLPTAKEMYALTTSTAILRSWRWPIPDEAVVFGGDGSDGTYGLWYCDPDTREPLVVEVEEPGDLPAQTIAGDNFASFLAGRSAFYIWSFGLESYCDSEPALDILGVPMELRELDESDETYDRFLRWANPNLPEPDPNPYPPAWSTEQVNEFARGRA